MVITMARPEKSKRICMMPSTVNFFSRNGLNTEKTANIEDQEDPVTLSIEEFETVRLIDYSGLTQQECASQMHVARTTVQRLYTEARSKIAHFLVDGSSLSICGGNYELCQNSDRCCKKFGYPRLSCDSSSDQLSGQCSHCSAFV